MGKKVFKVLAYASMVTLAGLIVCIFGFVLWFHRQYLDLLPSHDEIDAWVKSQVSDYRSLDQLPADKVDHYVNVVEPNYWEKHLPDWTNFFDSKYPGSPQLTHELVKNYFIGNFDYEDPWWSEQVWTYAFIMYMDNKVFDHYKALHPEMTKEELELLVKQQLLERYLNIAA